MACPEHDTLILYRILQLSKHFHVSHFILPVIPFIGGINPNSEIFKNSALKSLNELSKVTQQVCKLRPSLKVESCVIKKRISLWLTYIQNGL